MPVIERTKRRAFTLIELLVVVAIIALLISILLPSLANAREQARAAKCGAHLKQFGTGLETYFSEFNDWIPGVNTTGVATQIAARGQDIGALRRPHIPVQSYDWMSPFLRFATELGANRAERFGTLVNEYSCPSMQGLRVDGVWALEDSPDSADFLPEIYEEYIPLSYLMPMHFQWWGQRYAGSVIATGLSSTGRPIPVEARVSSPGFAAVHFGGYQSRRDKVGPASRKIAAADGLRYLDADDSIDFDVSPNPPWFGAFCSNGGWWAGSQAYGVMPGTANWDGTIVNTGDDPEARGRNLAWSYRHGSRGNKVTQGVRDNTGEINALFFDGHVARLNDRASRNIEFWYPSGTTAQPGQGGLTDVPANYEVP